MIKRQTRQSAGIMGRAQKTAPGQHRHCEKCFNRQCQVPVELTVSCLVINCHSRCGAAFHMCKQEEHQLLCPLEQVPCLNSAYGCPSSMARFKLAKHLQVCPASVVHCSMEWNRWPNVDSETILHKNIMKHPHNEQSLDTALALRDQKILFRTLKMAELFPEWREDDEMEEPGAAGLDEGAVGGITGDSREADGQVAELTQQERENLAKDKEGMDLASYKTWENMFSKELSALKATGLSANSEKKEGDSYKKTGQTLCGGNPTEKTKEAAIVEDPKESKNNQVMAGAEKTGLAPWQDGILERLKKEVNIGDYNMYLVHHGRMLIHFGQLAACTPREKDFVYGNLEAHEVKTVCTFKVPVSYHGKRARLADTQAYKVVTMDKSVDTSDLQMSLEECPQLDIARTTLLCALEKELKGHEISEAKNIDGLFMDFGTQTYNFQVEPFSSRDVLADVLDIKSSPGLHVELHTECVTRRHNKSCSAFTFTCNHFFRRDEFPSHFKNVHTDIQSCLNGWFQQRCPLAYLGCTFVQNRFYPATQKATFIYSQHLDTLAIQPEVDDALSKIQKCNFTASNKGKNKDSLSSLPLELLQYIAGFLDNFSLSQLSQVSVLMRDICATLLQERGMVFLLWEKKRYSHGGTSWRARKKIWQFSSLFAPVNNWQFSDIPSMSEHLKICPFYDVEHKKDPFLLVSMSGPQKQAQNRLVSTFKHRS
nr:F-box only protein 40 isoform X1 [Pelodiscus sinensis]|eukprot:XP_006124237.1 F-box only protein 40 isoform X1 [Pelodiscus sinensis]